MDEPAQGRTEEGGKMVEGVVITGVVVAGGWIFELMRRAVLGARFERSMALPLAAPAQRARQR